MFLHIRAAAALVFHTPGLGMRVTWDNSDVLVAPSAVPGAHCHPADVRQACGDWRDLAALLGDLAPPGPASPGDLVLSVAPVVPGVEDLGGGLIRVNDSPPLFVFATAVDPGEIFPIAKESQTMPEHAAVRQSGPCDDDQMEFLTVRALRDPWLEMTVVVIDPASTHVVEFPDQAVAIARATAVACMVAEITQHHGEELL